MSAKKTILAMCAGALLGSPMIDIAAFSSEGEVPSRVLLMPFGENKMGDGRGTIRLRDQKHAEAVVAATRKALGNREFMFDYDHAAVKIQDQGTIGEAIASGWAKDFEIDAKGIWASDIEWTPAGKAKIAAGEYRYISPWFYVNTKTGDLISFINAALVNRPALDLEAIAASLNSTTECEDMDLKAIAAALGLPEDADEAAVLAAIGKLNETQTAVAAALKAKEGDDLAAVAAAAVTAAASNEPDPKDFVPMTAFQQLQATVDTLTKDRHEAIVGAAIRDGKITPAQKDWAASYLQKHGETEFASFIDSAPKIIGDRVVPKGEPKAGEHALDEDEKSIAAALGITSDEDLKAYAANLKKEAA